MQRNDEGAAARAPFAFVAPQVAFTLGPWSLTGVSRGGFNVWAQADRRPAWIVCARSDIEYRADESEANARLIAAAPELYDALKDLLLVIDAAGLINLSNGVQFGQTVWFVKASDAREAGMRAIAKVAGRARAAAHEAIVPSVEGKQVGE